MKKTVLFLVETLAFTLIAKALAAWLFALPVTSMSGQVAVWFVFGLAILGEAWIFNRLLRGWGLRELGFRLQRSFAGDIWLGVCGFAVSNVLSLPMDLAASHDRANMAHGLVSEFHFSSTWQVLLGGAAMAVALGFFTGAFHEEIRFRGYYQGAGTAELAPLAGLLTGLIPFSLGHYYAQPDWSAAQVAATVIPGLVYGLLFYATRSLTATMTAHTLTNLLPFLPFLLHEVTGRSSVMTGSIYGLVLVSVAVIALRWTHEFAEWRAPIRQLFTDRPLYGLVAGVIIGGALLLLWPREFQPVISGLAGLVLFAATLAAKKWHTARVQHAPNSAT